jgi:hypothetical protein
MSSELELFCPHCQATENCGPQRMLSKLRSISVLRREADPETDLLIELFRSSADRFACPICKQTGLHVREPPSDDWDTVQFCESCAERIPTERLEIFPSAKRCAKCEAAGKHDANSDREFCPKCGEVLNMRLRRGSGIAKYQMTCPRCGK